MTTALEVFDPSGATEISELHANRLDTLEAKTIGFLSNDMWQAHRMLPLVREWLSSKFNNIELLEEHQFPMGNSLMDTEEAVDQLIERGVDAVVIGNAA